MDKRKIMICFLMVLLASVSLVSAENVYADGLNATYSFHDLQKDINSCGNELNLTHDYSYASTDKSPINIAKNLTINGNNHVIDARNRSMIFDVTSSSLTINNLVLKNANTAINARNSNVTTVNVVFANNTQDDFDGGAVWVHSTNYRSVNDMFLDNKAEHGSAIYAGTGSVLDITNATFKSSFPLEWGLILAENSEIRIADVTFSNISSKYSTVLYGASVRGFIKNSRFENLHADKTAGAVALKGIAGCFTFDNCSFSNTSSRKNAGAIYIDLITEDMEDIDIGNINGTVYLKNSSFINCSSKFGGAYIQLNGKIIVDSCNFTNTLGYAGYTSHADSRITDCIFNDNSGGGVYFDFGSLTITNSKFKNSSMNYLYDAKYSISSTLFNGTNLYSSFDREGCKLSNNTFTDSKSRMNMKNFTEAIWNDPGKVKFYNITELPVLLAKEKRFNLKDYGLVSPAKDQGSVGACWVFATVSAFESALLKIGISTDLSENIVYNAALQYSLVGVDLLYEGGESIYATQHFFGWLDMATEEDDDFDELGRVSGIPISSDYPHYSVETVVMEYDIETVKKALVNYGALYVPVSFEYKYMNMDKWAYYNNESADQDHAVNIIGWDDTYSRYNFKTPAPKDGAWIVKNSWGSDWGIDGCYYMSYYDLSLDSYDILGFKINPEVYDRIYQHEYTSDYFENEADFYVDGADEITYAQIYTSQENDLISAVGTYFEFEDTYYNIRIILNGQEIYTQSGASKHEGFEIIKLKSMISVGKNDKFTVEISRGEMPHAFMGRAQYDTANSYYIIAGKKYKVTDEIPVVKVYTISNPIKASNIVKVYTKTKTEYTISNVSGSTITVKVDGTKYSLNIKNNKATLSLNLKAGLHKVTTYYSGKTIINHILVKTSIISKRTLSVPYHAKKTLSVKFINSKGEVLKNRQITYKFNSKTYKAKTDRNGVAKISISSKLKIARHYLTCTNPETGESAKILIKVISRFSSNRNLNMYYFDGSCYKVRVIADNGNYIKNKVFKIKIDKKTYRVKSDKKGWIKLKIPSGILPGKHKIKMTYKGQTVSNRLNVKKILTLKVKKSSKKIVITAKLKKKLKNKRITFKINGKKFIRKTNRNGIVKIAAYKLPKVRTYDIRAYYYLQGVRKNIKV